jgi:hypothetical protein
MPKPSAKVQDTMVITAKPKVGRKPLFGKKLTHYLPLKFSPSVRAAVDAFRDREGLSSSQEAVRKLVFDGLVQRGLLDRPA